MATLPKFYVLYPSNNNKVQALPEEATAINSVVMAGTSTTSAAIGTMLAPVTGVPGTTQVQFNGTVSMPSARITLGVAPVTNQALLVSCLVSDHSVRDDNRSQGNLIVVHAVPARHDDGNRNPTQS